MNFKISVISGNQLPIGDPNGSSDPYVVVYQNCHAKIQVGMTNAVPQNLNPVWNYSCTCHGIRGMKFLFEIFDYDRMGPHDKMGKAVWDAFHYQLGQPVVLPVIPDKDDIVLPAGWRPSILVQVDMIETQPTKSPIAGMPIPPNNVIYATLAFSPEYKPKLPVINSGFGFIPCPLDIGIVAFGQDGSMKTICFNSETKGIGVQHSGITFCFCYDTFAPSLRIDITDLFWGPIPAVRAIVTVSTNNPKVPLSDFKWIALDFYISSEKQFQRFDDKIVCHDPNLALPLFHTRFTPTYAQGSTTSVCAALTPTPQGVSITPVQWFAPNQFIQFTPYSNLEILPELATLAGIPPYNVKRRVACVPGCSASLNRAMMIQGYQTIVPIRIGLGWTTNTDLDASCLLYNAQFQHLTTVFYNHREDGPNRGVIHSGDNRTGVGAGDDEVISVDFSRLPPQVQFLCFTITSFKNVQFTKVKESHIRVIVGNDMEIFRVNLKKSAKATGLFFVVIYRAPNGEWNIFPSLLFTNANVPSKMQPFVAENLKRFFGASVY